jgi:uncharacterized membrane protein YjjB (DUF3815 family)
VREVWTALVVCGVLAAIAVTVTMWKIHGGPSEVVATALAAVIFVVMALVVVIARVESSRKL